MVVGFSGRADISNVDFLVIRCAGLVVTGSPGSYSVSVGAVTALSGAGNPLGGTPFGNIDCPVGQVATVAVIRADDELRAFGLECSTPELTY
jgi:hypothetical protein